MKLTTNPRFPLDLPGLVRYLTEQWRNLAEQVNGLSEGRATASYNAATAAPTTGTYAVGDFVRNAEPTELGAPGGKYIVDGWKCVTAGDPGTWVECRYLTGN